MTSSSKILENPINFFHFGSVFLSLLYSSVWIYLILQKYWRPKSGNTAIPFSLVRFLLFLYEESFLWFSHVLYWIKQKRSFVFYASLSSISTQRKFSVLPDMQCTAFFCVIDNSLIIREQIKSSIFANLWDKNTILCPVFFKREEIYHQCVSSFQITASREVDNQVKYSLRKFSTNICSSK